MTNEPNTISTAPTIIFENDDLKIILDDDAVILYAYGEQLIEMALSEWRAIIKETHYV